MSRMDRYHNPKSREYREDLDDAAASQYQESREDYGDREPYVKQKPPKKRKRKGKFRFFLKLLLLLLIIAGGYTVYGYHKGYTAAQKDTSIGKVKVKDFNGQKAVNGTNILLLGSDSRGSDQGRSDTLMVVHLDGMSQPVKLISFMRDLYVDIPGYGKNKINAAYSYGGPELVRKTLKENFDLDIQYYAVVNFKSFPKVIDTLCPDGVAINAEKDMSREIDANIKKGQQTMNGYTLLQYARFRQDEEGDFGRVRRQQQVMNAVMKEAISVQGLLKLPEAAGTVAGYTANNIPVTKIMQLGSSLVLNKASGLKRMTVPNQKVGAWQYGSYADAGSVLEITDWNAYNNAVKNFFTK